MSLLEILLIALALAIDAFSVGAAVGLTCRKPRQMFRLAFHFGLFQSLMPMVGALAGAVLERWIAPWDHWLAFGLLLFIGVRMIRSALGGRDERAASDPTRGLSLVGLSLAVSIDALAVGFTLSLYRASIPLAVTIIGLVAATLTLVGMLAAGRIAARMGQRAEIAAALVLIGIGAKILIAHLT